MAKGNPSHRGTDLTPILSRASTLTLTSHLSPLTFPVSTLTLRPATATSVQPPLPSQLPTLNSHRLLPHFPSFAQQTSQTSFPPSRSHRSIVKASIAQPLSCRASSVPLRSCPFSGVCSVPSRGPSLEDYSLEFPSSHVCLEVAVMSHRSVSIQPSPLHVKAPSPSPSPSPCSVRISEHAPA
nr:vegetative cell wall protein gp1 [Arachis hypogaea]